jgi:hypothetical protein
MYDLMGPSDLHDPRLPLYPPNPHVSSYHLPAIQVFLGSVPLEKGHLRSTLFFGTISHVLYTGTFEWGMTGRHGTVRYRSSRPDRSVQYTLWGEHAIYIDYHTQAGNEPRLEPQLA